MTSSAPPILCLICNPADPRLDSGVVAKIRDQVGGELRWLKAGVACEIVGVVSGDAATIAREIVGEVPVDVAVVAAVERRKRLLVADMDSTMIEQECIDELAAALGIKAQVAEITERAMRGELDFAQALDTRVALLRGLDRQVVEAVRDQRITLAAGGRTLVQTMRAHGAYASLVSGGFTIFAEQIAARLGFDEAVANVLEFSGDRLAGTVAKPIVDKDTKLNRLRTLAGERAIPMTATLAVGDGANDLAMIRAAGLGVALRAKPAVAAEAAARIDHGDLTALLYLQGYAETEFVIDR